MQEAQRDVVRANKGRPSDEVLSTAERLINRLNGMQSNLHDLRDRISGAQPPSAGNGLDSAVTQFVVGGFVGTAGQALERAHSIVADIETTIANIVDVI